MLVEDVAALGGQLQQPLREAVVVLLLLGGVVQGGVAKVLVAVGDEEFFELYQQIIEGHRMRHEKG